MELLPYDIRQIVYRFVFDDTYRTVREQYKASVYVQFKSNTYHDYGITVNFIGYAKVYQWRFIHSDEYYVSRKKRQHGYVFSKFRQIVGTLSPNY